MIIGQYNKTEVYEGLCEWWEKHKFPVLDIDFLPETFFTVEVGEEVLYGMFVYRTDSKLAWIAFPISNPDLTKEEKKGGLEFLINGITEILKESGFKYIFTTSPLPVVQEALLNTGFNLGDEKANHYLKKIV